MTNEHRFLRLGLTGGIASGKSTVAAMLHGLGCGIVDADQCARDVVAPGSEGIAKVREAFGDGVLTPEGGLDRDVMRAMVFANPDLRRRLEAITHPLISREVMEAFARFEREGRPAGVVEAALIFEAKAAYALHAVIAVIAGRENQAARLVERSRWTRVEIDGVLDAQMSDEERIRKADFIIRNFGTLDELQRSVNGLWEKLSVELMKNNQ